MQIKGLLTGLQSYEQSKINKAKARDRGSPGSKTADSASDKVTLSQDAKLYRAGLDQALKADEVRTERVQELKVKVQDGTYEPNSRRIAEKMIREDLESWFQFSE